MCFSAGPPPVTLPYYSEENLAKHGDVLDHNSKPNLYMTGMSDAQNDHMCSGAPDHGELTDQIFTYLIMTEKVLFFL